MSACRRLEEHGPETCLECLEALAAPPPASAIVERRRVEAMREELATALRVNAELRAQMAMKDAAARMLGVQLEQALAVAANGCCPACGARLHLPAIAGG